MVSTAASAARWSSVAALATSAAACASTALLSPGWRGVACAGGLLRSWGHLQLLAFTDGLAFHTPPAFRQAAGGLSWTLLGWLPASATPWAEGYSHRLRAMEGAVPPPPPPYLQVGTRSAREGQHCMPADPAQSHCHLV